LTSFIARTLTATSAGDSVVLVSAGNEEVGELDDPELLHAAHARIASTPK